MKTYTKINHVPIIWIFWLLRIILIESWLGWCTILLIWVYLRSWICIFWIIRHFSIIYVSSFSTKRIGNFFFIAKSQKKKTKTIEKFQVINTDKDINVIWKKKNVLFYQIQINGTPNTYWLRFVLVRCVYFFFFSFLFCIYFRISQSQHQWNNESYLHWRRWLSILMLCKRKLWLCYWRSRNVKLTAKEK